MHTHPSKPTIPKHLSNKHRSSCSRGKRSVREVALELNVSYHTAKNWMKRGHPDRASTSAGKEKRPQDWSAPEQLQALNETHALSGEALQAWRLRSAALR